MQLFIEIRGDINSLELWTLIEPYKVNLTDLIDKSLVYGDVSMYAALEVISRCALYGRLQITLTPPK